MKWKRWFFGLMISVLAAGCFGILPAEAAAPKKDTVEYEGYGIVECEFTQEVQYKNPKVTVKDNVGREYTAVITLKNSKEIKFKIRNYRKGAKYTFRITGVRKKGTKLYGKVNGTVIITKHKLAEDKIKKIAIADAVKRYGIKKSTIKMQDLEFIRYSKGWYVKVEFTASKPECGCACEVKTRVDCNSGKIVSRKIEWK
ncbi:MAG: hypothetical protein Q4F25_02325 [Eubacteriales bacterium]|nr:hypothetical protein [Eubacteriales bacterium]